MENKVLYITENQASYLGNLILENEGTNIKKARRFLEQHGYANPNERQEILNSIRNNIPNSRLMDCYYLLGVTRLYIEGQLSDSQNIRKLNTALKYIASEAHFNDYDNNLNGLSLQEIDNRFSGVAKQDLERAKEQSNQKQLVRNNEYKIVRIPDFETSEQYGEYTDWCVTHYENMYDTYTSSGMGLFYFCLKNGFENIPRDKGNNCPLDEYGLSMIAVSVTMEGECNTITCRWNHDNGGNDNIMTVDELENLLGVNFYQTFLPYTREELHARGIILFDEVQSLLDSGKRPKEIFNEVCHSQNGFTLIRLNDKWNYINTENRLLSDQWFDEAYNFENGFAVVELYDNNGAYESYNFINTEGKILCNQWFDEVSNFNNGLAAVELNGKGCNFINTDGEIAFDQWFDYADSFSEGFAVVELNNKRNFINTDGKILCDQCFDYAYSFSEGFARVELNNKWNFINTDGEIAFGQWFNTVYSFSDGFASVQLNHEWNFINTEGKTLCKQWFDCAYSFSEGFARVRLNGKWYYLDTNGNLYNEKPNNLNENYEWNEAFNYEPYIKSITKFLGEQGLTIKPYPKVILDKKGQEGLYIRTGYYEPNKKEIHLFINSRHPKDVLRSYVHEYIHHMQNLEGRIGDYKGDTLDGDDVLQKMESEAYLKGNIYFRKWTEECRPNFYEKKGVVNEGVLLENMSTNMTRARKYLKKLGYTDEKERWDIINKVRNKVDNSRLMDCFYLLGATRLYVEGQLTPPNDEKLNSALKYIASDEFCSNYDSNLNGLSLKEIYSQFEQRIKKDLEDAKAASNANVRKRNTEYTIVRIPDFETSEQYGKYTDWCVTHNEEMYDTYTSSGMGLFYFCLRNGFENETETPTENCPLDKYGLSMIAVSVTSEGECHTITCRWNHRHTIINGKDIGDHIMSVEQLEEILGVNFYQTFLPYTREELHARGIILFDEVQSLLDSGKRPKEIFNEVCHSQNGFTLIRLNDKWNYINTENRLLSDQWFDDVWHFENGFGVVVSYDNDGYNKYNFINTEGKILCNQCFDYADSFSEGFARVELNNKGWNFINTDGKILCDQCFDYAYSFSEGFARVELNNKWNFINTDGKILCDQCFDYAYSFSDGFASVQLNNKWNFINTDGKILCDQCFDYAYSFSEGFARVELNNKWNFINTDGKILCNQWFDEAYHFENNGFAPVYLNNQHYYLDVNGNLHDEILNNLNETTNPKDINLDSFNIKKNLNPKFWKDERLDSRVRMKLLDIADDFIEFLGVDWVKPDDITMTGSLANFNWNDKFSDIDLHIIMDYSKVDKRKDFVSNYFYSQKKLWNEEHKELKIMGFPVEIYVQDKNEKHNSTGVYSLDKDKWIMEPERKKLSSAKVNKSYIKKKVAEYIDKIEDLLTIYKEHKTDDYKIRKVSEDAEKLFNDIKKERSNGLKASDNEISNGNIIFKCLRRMGYIEKIVDLLGKTYDKINSLA